jgi:protein gp37
MRRYFQRPLQWAISRPFPLPNVWLGVSVEDQATADERITLLLQTPAAVRFVSYEPALGPVDFSRWMWPMHWHWDGNFGTPEQAIAAGAFAERKRQALVSAYAVFLDWLIVGGESGPGARPFDVAWARSAIRQCREAGVPVFIKQLGARPWEPVEGVGPMPMHLKNAKGGVPAEWPEDLRVREFPA